MRKSVLAIVLAVLLVLGMAGISTVSHASTIYSQIELSSTKGALSGWCVNDPGNSTVNGTAVQLWACGTTNEGFQLEASSYAPGGKRYYELVLQNGMCLGDYNGGGDGTKVVVWTCNGGADQAVSYAPYSSGSWPTAWVFATGYALGDQNDTAKAGNPITVWSPNASNSEAWTGPNLPSTVASDTKGNCITIASDGPDVSTANLSAAEQTTGITFHCLETFANPAPAWSDWENPWQFDGNTSWASWLASSPDNQLVLGMDLVPWSATGTTVAPVADPLTWEEQGAAGDFASYATTLAKNLVAEGAFANGQPLIVRLGIEANGNWEADYVGNTAQEATDWAETYDSEVAAMRAVPGTNFEFVWNPNACYSSGVSSLAAWYPGNAYVDIVGADLYDADCTNQDSAATEGFSALAADGSPSLNAIESFAVAHAKPLAIPEWGLTNGDDPAYVKGIGNVVNDDDTSFQAYFDDGDDGVTQLGSTVPQSVAAYQAAFSGNTGPA